MSAADLAAFAVMLLDLEDSDAVTRPPLDLTRAGGVVSDESESLSWSTEA